MKLVSAKITKYKSIDDSTQMMFEDVTAFVGKNESGKTAVLQALEKLNPVESSHKNFNPITDYPRKEFTKYEKIHKTSPAQVVAAEFELSSEEVEEIASTFGEGVLLTNKVRVFKNYQNQVTYNFDYSEMSALLHLAKSTDVSDDVLEKIKGTGSLAAALEVLSKLQDQPPSTTKLVESIKRAFPQGLPSKLSEYLAKITPAFLYFGDYSIMSGKINLQDILTKKSSNPDQLSQGEETFLSMLANADTKLEDFSADGQGYETLKARLEAASASITDEVFQYWSQNQQLRVEFDIAAGDRTEKAPFNAGTNVHVRIYNEMHRVSVPFDERSRGFVWFFSFLAYFSQLEATGKKLIVLLDEPGLNLHGKAQADLLRFIEERVGDRHQVIYSTHSPFMIDTDHLERVRTVEDAPGRGTRVSSNFYSSGSDTKFPLQAALGFDIAQSLFVGRNNLVIEGLGDEIYLRLLSACSEAQGGIGLDPRWVPLPANGADKIPTYVSLLGANSLNVAVLMDVSSKDQQRFDSLMTNGFLKESSLVRITEFTLTKEADIEDMFSVQFYLSLVNGAYSDDLKTPLTERDLGSSGQRIVKKIEEVFAKNGIAGGKFSHLRPAEFLLNERERLLKTLDNETIKRFQSLFLRLSQVMSNSHQVGGKAASGIRTDLSSLKDQVEEDLKGATVIPKKR